MNAFLLEPTHGHPTSNNFFWHRKPYRHVEYILKCSKNIHEPYIPWIAPSIAKRVKNSKLIFFAWKVSSTSGVSIVPNSVFIR